jgi:hypothetical protein
LQESSHPILTGRSAGVAADLPFLALFLAGGTAPGSRPPAVPETRARQREKARPAFREKQGRATLARLVAMARKVRNG